MMDISTGTLGKTVVMKAGEYGLKKDYTYVDGDFFRDVDMSTDKGKDYVIINPTL